MDDEIDAPIPGLGACISCGLLGFTSKREGYRGVVHELDDDHRWGGTPLAEGQTTLLCLRRMAQIQEEVDEAKKEIAESGEFEPSFGLPTAASAALRRRLLAPRPNCTSSGVWHPYHPFFNPQWHYEDWRMMELEKLRQAQMQMTADALRSIENIQTEHVKIMARAERESTRFNRFFVILGIATLVLAIAALASTVAYPNGVTWVVDNAPGATRDRSQPTPAPQSTPDTEVSPAQ